MDPGGHSSFKRSQLLKQNLFQKEPIPSCKTHIIFFMNFTNRNNINSYLLSWRTKLFLTKSIRQGKTNLQGAKTFLQERIYSS